MKRETVFAVLLLIAAPAILLRGALFGGQTYHPWDPAQFPPASYLLDDDAIAQVTAPPRNFDVTEIPGLVVPELQLARAELAAGRFPGWNPYARFGAPLFANGLAAMSNPLNALFLLGFDPRSGLAWRTWCAFAIAGLLALGLFRRLGLSTAAAVFGALVFQLGGTLAANGPFYMRLDALIWLPGLVWATHALCSARAQARIGGTLGLAACTAMTLLAGFPPYAVASLLVTGLFALAFVLGALRTEGRRSALGLSAWLAGGVLLGTALAAVQLAPMFAFFPESNRRLEPTTSAILAQGFDAAGLLGYLLPSPFGFPGEAALPYGQSPLAHLLWTRTIQATGSLRYPLNFGYTEYAIFPGSLGLLFALLGIPRVRDARLRPLLVVFPILLLLAIAPNPLGFLYHLPVVASVQPMRLLAPSALIVALLAAAGFERAIAPGTHRSTFVLAGVAAALALLAWYVRSHSPLTDAEAVIDRIFGRFAGPERPTLTRDVVARLIPKTAITAGHARLDANLLRALWTMLGAGGLLALLAASRGRLRQLAIRTVIALSGLELLVLAAPLNGCRDLVADPTDTPIHAFLLAQNEAHAADGGIVIARAAPLAEDPLVLPPGLLFPLRLRDLNSYAFVDGRSHLPFLELYDAQQMIRNYWPKTLPDDLRLERPFFDLIGLRFVVSTVALEHAGRRVGPERIGPRGTPFYVYEREAALPRAFVVHALREVADDGAAARAMVATDFEPRAALLTDPETALALGARAHDPAPPIPRAVRFVTADPDHVVLEVEAGPAGYLVCADAPMRGWTATLDGAPTPIHRGDLFMRVVAVPASAARVEFHYSPPGLFAGILISTLAALGVAAALLRLLRSSRRRRTVDESAR